MLSILRAAGQSFDLAGLERVIAQLLKTGFADGFLSIQARKTRKYLELTKYIRAKGDYGIRLHVPVESWSEAYLGMVQAHCSSEGIEFSFESRDPEIGEVCLCIDCRKNASKAYGLVRTIFTRIFGVPESNTFSVVLRNGSPWDELIEDRHQEPLSLADGMRSKDAAVQSKIGVSLRDVSLNMLLAVAQMSGVIGVVYSLSFANHKWAWSDTVIGDISIKAPIAALFFCGVIMISFLRVATRSFWIGFDDNKKIRDASKMMTQIRKVAYVLLNYLNIISIVLLNVAALAWTSAHS